jgi:hypothetical protein
MTREDFLKEIDNLDDEYFQKRWKNLIKKYGEQHAKDTYGNQENYKQHILNHYRNGMASNVEADCEVIKLYYDCFNKVGKEEFVEKYGDFKLLILNNALRNQRIGFWAYAEKV